MLSFFEGWLVGHGVEVESAAMATTAAGILVVVVLALVADFVAKRVLVRVVVGLAKRSETSWDDVVVGRRVFHRLAHLAPALAIYFFAPAVLGGDTGAPAIIRAGCLLFMVVAVVSVLDGLINATVDIVGRSQFGRGMPLTTIAQVTKLVLYGTAIIVAVSVIFDESPALLLSGLGAMTAVLMLIFKDPILGFVGGIQLSANRMLMPGDWIEMPKYGADGDVVEVALTTVKVQNWDKTITTIPTYALISESFKNWRGMAESEGRRIKRAVNIDMSTIKFCDDAMVDRLSRIHYMAGYLEQKRQEIEAWNVRHEKEPSTTMNPRRLTNLGTFRAYVMAYLRHHPQVHQQMTLLVRQLGPTEHGLPIEIYAFSVDQNWARYEAIQSDIFDHLLAVLPEFDLRVYQIPYQIP